jgi:hypothetical protein
MNDVLTRYDQLTVRIPPGRTRIARVGLTYTHTHACIILHPQEEYKEKQIECEESAMALMNLQMVLEQFQSQKEAEVSKHPLAMLALPLPCTVSALVLFSVDQSVGPLILVCQPRSSTRSPVSTNRLPPSKTGHASSHRTWRRPPYASPRAQKAGVSSARCSASNPNASFPESVQAVRGARATDAEAARGALAEVA